MDVCPWPTESFSYDGLGTHSSFTEWPTGSLLASPEELRAADAEMKKRRLDAPTRWRERAKMRDSAKYLKLKRDERALYLLRHPDAQRKADKRLRERALAAPMRRLQPRLSHEGRPQEASRWPQTCRDCPKEAVGRG